MIDKAIFYVSIYIENIEKNIENPFWFDVVQAIKLLWEKFYPTNHTERLATPLWLSKEIFVHNSKENLSSGYRPLYDIVDAKGHLLSMHKLERSGYQCNVIEYNDLRIKTAKILGNLDINKREGPNIPLLLSLVGNEKGCSHLYKRLISRNGDILSKCAGKWSESLLEEISEVNLSQSFKKIDKDIDCTYVRYLQFRLLHRRIFTNELLYRMKIVDSPECPLCNNIPETIEHAFL